MEMMLLKYCEVAVKALKKNQKELFQIWNHAYTSVLHKSARRPQAESGQAAEIWIKNQLIKFMYYHIISEAVCNFFKLKKKTAVKESMILS